jgi:nucleoside-diphosphate-sugar epimerase
MRVFVTGASGWIGSAAVPELISAGHQVVGLARSDDSAAALHATGAEVVRGTLDDRDVLRAAASASDGVIHLAFKHDIAFTGDFQGAVDADRAAIETLGDALAGSDRPLVIASGILGLPVGATENDMPDTDTPAGARAANAAYTLSLAERGVRSSVLRLPPTVHGTGDNGFLPTIIGVARAKGVSAFVGDGTNRWPATHRGDVAQLFRLAAESAPAGTVLHAVDDEGVATRDIAEVIGRHLAVPVVSIPRAEAGTHFGWIGEIFAMDAVATSVLTRKLMGWQPSGPSLLDDLDAGHYF